MGLNEPLRKVAKGTAVAFFGMLVYTLFEFVSRVAIAKTTTQAEYGAFSVGIVLLNFFVIAACLGLQAGAPRCIAYFRGKGENAKVKGVIFSTLQFSVIASLLCFLLFFFSADFLTSLLHLQESAVLKIFSLAVPFFVAIEILASVFMGFERVQEQVYFRDLLMNVLKVLFIAIAILLGCSLLGMVYAYLLSIVIASIAFIIYAVKKLPLKSRSRAAEDPVTKDLLLFSLPLLVTYVLSVAILQTDTLMLGYFKTAAVVGLYNAAHPISLLILVFIISLSYIYLSIASQLYSKNLMDEIKRNYAVLTKWVFSATLPFFLILFLFPEAVLNLLFGSAYVNASFALRILAIGMFSHVFLGPNAATLVVIGKTKLNMTDDLIGAITNLSLNFLLIPPFGINGAAVAFTTSFAVVNLLKSAQIFRLHRIHPFTKNYLKPAITSIMLIPLIYMLIMNLTSTAILMPLFFFFLFLCAYGSCLVVTRSFDSEDVVILEEIGNLVGIDASRIKRMMRRFM